MNKRSIRLKEFIPNIEKVHIPTEKYFLSAPSLNRKQCYFQRVDKDGFMCSNLSFETQYKVFIIGDSFIENIFIDESKRITSMVEKFLLSSGKSIKVYNAGVSGATGLNLLNTVLNKIIFMKPDLIIFSQPCCDFNALQYENGYFNDTNYFSNILPAQNNDKAVFETIEENSYQILNNISILAKVCELYNTKLCITTCCSRSSKRQLKIMNDIIRNNAYLGYDVLDLDLLIPKNDHYFYDRAHLNSVGSEFVSDIIYHYVDSSLSCEKGHTKLYSEKINFSSYEINSLGVQSKLLDINKNKDLCISFKIKSHCMTNEKSSFTIKLKIIYQLDSRNFENVHSCEFIHGLELERSVFNKIPSDAKKVQFILYTDYQGDLIELKYFDVNMIS